METRMEYGKQQLLGRVLAIALGTSIVGVAAMAVPPHVSAKGQDSGRICAESTLRGDYGLLASGVRGVPPMFGGGTEHFVATALWSFHGDGTFTQRTGAALHGEVTGVAPGIGEVPGTYQVNENCTGSMALFVPDLRTYDVIADAANAAWTPKGSLELEASRDTFLFLSVTRGFKSGGVNIFTEQPGATFRPELAWSYEAGFKRTLPGGRGRLNAALFYVEYRDLQVQSFLGPGVVDVSNAAKATSKGIELEGTVSAGGGFQFVGILSWLDAVYGRYIAIGPGQVTMDAAGNRLSDAPKWSGSGAAIYEFQPAARGTVSVRGDVSWRSRVFFSPFNAAVQSQPAYALVHARATFVPGAGAGKRRCTCATLAVSST